MPDIVAPTRSGLQFIGSYRRRIAPIFAAAHAHHRHRRERAADDINEQRAGPAYCGHLAVQDVYDISELRPLQHRVLQLYDDVTHAILMEDGQRRVRRVRCEALRAFAPRTDELFRTDVPGDSIGPVGEEQGRRRQPVQNELAVRIADAVGRLYVEGLDLVLLLLDSLPLFFLQCMGYPAYWPNLYGW